MEKKDDSFIAELLDDYYAECDEHLTAIRRGLLTLESELNRGGVPSGIVNDLFRSFHTLKGLSAMVGLEPAQELAHQMENYLRALRSGELSPTVEALTVLSSAVQRLEEVIACHREKRPLPDHASIMAELAALLAAPAKQRSPRESQDTPSCSLDEPADERRAKLQLAWQKGQRTWRVVFTPRKELADQGFNVNSLRCRLQNIGELIDATPIVTDDGTVQFEFIVAGNVGEEALKDWLSKGVTVSEIKPSGRTDRSEKQDETAKSKPAVSFSGLAENYVRVDLKRLDELMGVVGELVIGRSRLENNLSRAHLHLPPALVRSLSQSVRILSREIRDLRKAIMRMRLVPIGQVFERLRYAARDLARQLGKKVAIEMKGENTEIDKHVVEKIMDPMLHLIRNAVSHGIETPPERLRNGKPETATLRLWAFTEGERVVIEVADDGRGIDLAKINARALQLGIIHKGEQLDSSAILDVLCEAGFSTREEADLTSGRGVGMAVVKDTVEKLGGALYVRTRQGQGTTFTLHLPLTLSIVDALIVAGGGQTFAVPIAAVHEVVAISPANVTVIENNRMIPYHGRAMPLISLSERLKIASDDRDMRYALVVGMAPEQVGIGVERLLGRREIVVRSLHDPLLKNPAFAGVTELGDGRAVLILEVRAFVKAHRRGVSDITQGTGDGRKMETAV